MARKFLGVDGRTTFGRRQFLTGAAAAVGASTLPTHVFAQAQKKVSFTLPWVPNGGSLFVFIAKDKGFWSKRGLDVEISRGFGSVASAQAIGQGKFDFGLSAAPAYYLQTVKGMSIVSLACANYDPTMGVMFLGASGIKSPKDLENTKMACTVASGEYPFLPLFARAAGFDLSKVTIVQTDNKIRTSVLLSNQVQSMSGFATSSMPTIMAKDIPVKVFLYSRFGMPFYGQMLVTQPERLKTQKGICEAMTEGAMEAVKWSMLNPEEAQRIYFKYVKEAALTKTGRQALATEFGMFAHLNLVPDVEAHGMGYVVSKSYTEMTKLIIEAMAKPEDKPPPLEQVLTNAFVTDKFKFSASEWEQVKAYAKPYGEMLA